MEVLNIDEFMNSMLFLGEVSQNAQSIPGIFGGWLTNSLVVSLAVVFLLVFMAQKVVRNLKPIPDTFQNFFEMMVESIYTGVEGIVGKKVAPKCFPLLSTIFIFFLFSNWFGLFPGVGTIGWGPDPEGNRMLDVVNISLLRPPAADLNNNFAIALVFMVVWLYITLKEVGLKGFLEHLFVPKGKFKGFMFIFMTLIFLFVGMIEVVSIVFRPLSLSLRIYGNIYAGENLLHVMSNLGPYFNLGPISSFILKVIIPIPFYFLELLVGLLQAVVFSLLCAVYVQLSTEHNEEH